LAALVPLAAAAQPASGRPRPRDEAFRMIDAYIVSNLQDTLGITDEQHARLLPLVTKLQRDRRALVQRRIQTLQELNRVVRQGGATEARVGELLRELKVVETEEPATIRRDMDAIDAVLTTVQQAKYRLLEVEVERRLRALMSEMRGQNRARRQRQMPPN
jgi:hypothetical protein